MTRLGCALGTIVLTVLLGIPLLAAPEAPDKETPARGTTVQAVDVSAIGVRHELVMVLVGTTLLVVAAVVRRTS